MSWGSAVGVRPRISYRFGVARSVGFAWYMVLDLLKWVCDMGRGFVRLAGIFRGV